MSDNLSLADRAVHALALVQAMDAEINNDHPERHVIRAMKRAAEAAIGSALRQAVELAYMARDASKLCDEVRAEEVKRCLADLNA